MTALTWEKGDSETLNVEVVTVLYYAADSTAKSGPPMRRRSSASEGRFGEAEPEGCASIRVVGPYRVEG